METERQPASKFADAGALSQPSSPGIAPLRITSLQWAVGGLCAAMGALMLVAPLQFASSAYTPLRPQLAWWGAGFIVAGVGLVAVAVLQPRRRFTIVAH